MESRSGFLQTNHGRGPFPVWLFPSAGQREPGLGVLQLTSADERSFAEHDVEFLSQVADQIVISLKNALQYEQVNKTNNRLLDENMALREQIDGASCLRKLWARPPYCKAYLQVL